MTRAALAARFWTAASYMRRWPDADHTVSIQLLKQIERYATGPLAERVAEILKEIPDDQQHGTCYDL